LVVSAERERSTNESSLGITAYQRMRFGGKASLKFEGGTGERRRTPISANGGQSQVPPGNFRNAASIFCLVGRLLQYHFRL